MIPRSRCRGARASNAAAESRASIPRCSGRSKPGVKATYDTVTIPSMSTGATDMAYLRGKGIQCYGIGPATDVEEGPLGFGAHSDPERILEAELHRFLRFQWDVVGRVAR